MKKGEAGGYVHGVGVVWLTTDWFIEISRKQTTTHNLTYVYDIRYHFNNINNGV